MLQRLSTAGELFLVQLICFGPFLGLSIHGLLEREETTIIRTGDVLLFLGIEVLCGLLAALILRARGWKWTDFTPPGSFLQSLGGMLLYFVTALVMTLAVGTYAAATRIDLYKVSKVDIDVAWWVAVLVVLINPLYDEFFAVAYPLRAGAATYGAPFMITLSALIRFACSLDSGPIAALTVLPLALVFAFVYWRFQRLWPLVIAHAALDLPAYLGV